MAVGPKIPVQPSLVRDYVPTLKKRMIITIILPAVLVGLICALLLLLTQLFSYNEPTPWIIAAGMTLLTAGSNSLIFIYMATPLSDIMQAIARVSGETTHGDMINPHDRKFVKSGLQPVLQAIYNLDTPAVEVADTDRTEGSNSIIHSLDRMHGALIALNDKREIVYASRSSPLHTVDGILRPQLLFNGSDSLETWLEQAEHNDVHAEKIWRRIPDRTGDQEDQRIFDVYASYEKGSPHETVLTLVDQTDLYKDAEEDLNFIAFAAHELRGPITVIRGYLDVLQDELSEVLEEDQKVLFHRLTVSANRLSGYINNILNTSRYDRRHLNLTLLPDTVAGIYATLTDDLSLRASSQNRLLAAVIPADLPQIAADRASLGEVISNLVDNAIKYSHEGGSITVTAEQNGDFVDIIVADQGIGMPGSVVTNLFQKFYRSHRSRETVAGTGIGLYISKAIVESHGGTISVRSTEGEGSTFTVSIPTYASVADKLTASNNNNQGVISQGSGWIKNHSMYRG